MEVDHSGPRPSFTSQQKTILKRTWLQIHHTIENVGAVTFLNLFETHPETLKPFLPHVNNVEQMELDEWYQEKLRIHSLRVMFVVEKTINRIENEENAAKMLSVFGRRHEGFGVTSLMLDLMSDSFVVAIEPALKDDWNSEVEVAWRQLFNFIVHCMVNHRDFPPEESATPVQRPTPFSRLPLISTFFGTFRAAVLKVRFNRSSSVKKDSHGNNNDDKEPHSVDEATCAQTRKKKLSF